MNEGVRKPRTALSAEAREDRHKQEAQRKLDEAAALEAALDEKIRRNIELYGP